MLGKGSWGKVYRARKKSKKKEHPWVAAKIVGREHLDNRELKNMENEISIMQNISHPNAVSLFDVFRDETRFVLILEICEGGHLLDRLKKHPSYTEKCASQIIKQVAACLKYLHDKQISHRDLKPENILFVNANPNDNTIKVTDFGLAHCFTGKGGLMHDFCGTPHYVSPQIVLKKPYTKQCDMWSLGVLLYVLLSGYPPFYGSKMQTLFRRIKKAQYDYKPKPFRTVTKAARKIIDGLLKFDPNERWTADELLQQPWVSKSKGASILKKPEVTRNIRRLTLRKKLKRGIQLISFLEVLRLIGKEELKVVSVMGERHMIKSTKLKKKNFSFHGLQRIARTTTPPNPRLDA